MEYQTFLQSVQDLDFNDLCDQFKISEPQTKELTNQVLHLTRDAIGEEKMQEFKDHFPYDWSAVVIPA